MKPYFNDYDMWQPDYDYWIRMPFWTYIGITGQSDILVKQSFDQAEVSSSEAVLLLMNFEPRRIELFFEWTYPLNSIDCIMEGFKFQDKILEGYNSISDLLVRVLEAGILNSTLFARGYRIKPNDLIAWARSCGIRYPEPFGALLKQTPPQDSLSSNCEITPDPEHSTDDNKFEGRKDIIGQFAKIHNINSWSGVKDKMKRNGAKFKIVSRNGKDRPTITLREIKNLTK
jgi:hypothetical protein